jgi:hypothetical protein
MTENAKRRLPALPYILPFVIFLLFIELAGRLPSGIAWVYPLQTVLVGLLLIAFRRSYLEISPTWRDDRNPAKLSTPPTVLLSVGVGIAVFVIWILPNRLGWRYPRPDELLWMLMNRLGLADAPPQAPTIFDPYAHFQSTGAAIVWMAFRLLRMAVVAPVMEELFWRSFLIRYLINPDFKQVPIGAFSWLSFIATVAFFGAEHHLWIVGLIAGAIYNLLLYRTRSLFACILAHAVTNLILGVYVLITHEWMYL